VYKAAQALSEICQQSFSTLHWSAFGHWIFRQFPWSEHPPPARQPTDFGCPTNKRRWQHLSFAGGGIQTKKRFWSGHKANYAIP